MFHHFTPRPNGAVDMSNGTLAATDAAGKPVQEAIRQFSTQILMSAGIFASTDIAHLTENPSQEPNQISAHVQPSSSDTSANPVITGQIKNPIQEALHQFNSQIGAKAGHVVANLIDVVNASARQLVEAMKVECLKAWEEANVRERKLMDESEAAKAENRRLQNDMETLDAQYRQKWEEKNRKLVEDYKRAVEENGVLRSEVEKMIKAMEEANARERKSMEECEAAKAQNRPLQDEMETMEAQCRQKVEEKNGRLEEDCTKAVEEIYFLRGELKKMTEAREEARIRESKLVEECKMVEEQKLSLGKEIEGKTHKMKKENESLKAELQSFQFELEKSRTAAAQKDAQWVNMKELGAENSTLKGRVSSLKAERDEMKSELYRIEDKWEETKNELYKTKTELDETKNDLYKSEDALSTMKMTGDFILEQINHRVRTLEVKLEEKTKELRKSQNANALASYRDAATNLKTVNEKLKDELEGTQSGFLITLLRRIVSNDRVKLRYPSSVHVIA